MSRPVFVEGAKASREGREAVKAGLPRVSPYEGIPALEAWHRNWLFGYDALAEVIAKDPTIWGLPEPMFRSGTRARREEAA